MLVAKIAHNNTEYNRGNGLSEDNEHIDAAWRCQQQNENPDNKAKKLEAEEDVVGTVDFPKRGKTSFSQVHSKDNISISTQNSDFTSSLYHIAELSTIETVDEIGGAETQVKGSLRTPP